MMNWLRCGPMRRPLLKFTSMVGSGRVHDWLLDFLYPSDAQITFKE